MHVWLRSSPRALLLVASADDASSITGAGSSSSSSSRGQSVLVVSTAVDEFGARSSSSSNYDVGAPSSSSSPARAVVEMVSSHDVDLSTCRRLTDHSPSGQEPSGCLGLMNVGNDLFLCVVTGANQVGPIRPGEHVMSITSVAFFCVNRPTWDGLDVPDLHNPLGQSGSSGSLDPYDSILPSDRASVANATAASSEHPCASLKRLLSMGSFYYAADGAFDISTRLDRRIGPTGSMATGKSIHDLSQYDGRFVWNTFMIHPLMDFRNRLEPFEKERLDSQGFFLLAIQGYVAVFDMSPPKLVYSQPPETANSEKAEQMTTSISLVSRLSWKRAGTRFNTRGVDDDGNVANFVESETLLNHEGVSVSYVQLRGSVPLFWEQQGLQAFSPRIQITRSHQASQPAFDRHFADLISHYARVHVLNLLGTRDAETVLTNAYTEHIRSSLALEQAVPPQEDQEVAASSTGPDERLGITTFDFHSVSRATGGLDGVRSELNKLAPVRLKRDAFSCTIVDSAGTVRRRQAGVMRTNCLDCLDRTNVVQAMLSEALLEDFFLKAARHRESFGPFSGGAHPIWSHHRVLWAENGDALSRIYAGTGALNTTYTRTGNAKKTIGSFLSDAAKSAGRMYINNFQDKGKQNVIDALLGNMANQRSVEVYDPLHDAVASELKARLDEYSTKSTITLFTGTWNLNAKSPGESLLPWLCPDGMVHEPDIYAIGFQEIVPLSPQQILLTDPAKLRTWENVILDELARRPGQGDYIILRSEQLVGTALVILVKSSLIGHIRAVEATTRKTGLKGMSGNKGGVAIRLQFHDSSICFVTAHLAAGHSNVEERNTDYSTISRGLAFQRGRAITGHDHVIWLGDFNYRIDLPNDRARPLAYGDDYATLLAHDQLQRSHNAGTIFGGFREGNVTFRPTYKYDVGTDVYDSSEKQRVPAWTDRVLYSINDPTRGGHSLQQTSYSCADLKTSDHRPVYATFRAEVRIFDKDKRNALRRELLSAAQSHQARVGLASGRAPVHNLPPMPSSESLRNGAVGVGASTRAQQRMSSAPSTRPNSSASSYSRDVSDAGEDLGDDDDWGLVSSGGESGDEGDALPEPSFVGGGSKSWFDTDSDGATDADATLTGHFGSHTDSGSSSGDDSSSGSSHDASIDKDTKVFGRNPFRSRLVTLCHGSDDESATVDAAAATNNTASDQEVTPTPSKVFSRPTPPPPPRSSKPLAASAGVTTTSSPSPLPPAVPPRRPGMGMRSASYQSTKSSRSLLDDSD